MKVLAIMLDGTVEIDIGIAVPVPPVETETEWVCPPSVPVAGIDAVPSFPSTEYNCLGDKLRLKVAFSSLILI